MKNNHEGAAPTPTTLLDDLHALVAQAEKMISDSQADASPDVLGAMRARFDAAQERLTGMYDGARKKVVAGAKCTDEAIRSNPYKSIAVAAGVGLLVGVLAGRSTR